MSKERELLQFILNSHAANGSKLDKFWKAKIEELLAQPEHTAEPVAWYWEGCDLDDPEWIAMADTGDKPIEEDRCKRNIQPLYLAPQKREQTEQEPEAWMLIDKETGARIPKAYKPEHGVNKDRWELYPLFASPPTREPFEPEERQRLSKAYSTRAEQVAFEEGIIFAEISYSIGGGE